MTADVERDAELARSLAVGAGLAPNGGGRGGLGGGDEDAAAAAAGGGPFDPHALDEGEHVRAPIPVMRDTLYGPAATYYRGGGGGAGVAAGRGNGGAAADAAAAAAAGGPSSSSQRRPNDTRPRAAGAFSSRPADEKEAAGAAGGKPPSSSSSAAPRLPPPPAPAACEAKGLAGLFAPPAGLLFAGDFQQAAEAAATARRWLVANVQAEAEFASHRLNRDTWRDPALRMLLSESFVFWQGDASAEDGATVARHYRLLPPAVAEALVEAAAAGRGRRGGAGRERGDLPTGSEQRGRPSAAPAPSASEVAKLIPPGSLPAILVVDPATGLAMRTWTGFVAAERLAEELGPFLDHAFDEPGARELAASGAAAARRRRAAEAAAACSAAAAAALAGRAMTEEEELAAALALSAADAQGGGGEEEEQEDDEDDEDFVVEDDDNNADDEIVEEEREEEEEKVEEEARAPPPSSPPPVVAPEPAEGVPRLSVALRLPDGGRASRHFAKDGSTLLDLFEWCHSLLLLEQEQGQNKTGSRRRFCLKETFPGAVPMAREGAERVSLESVCGGGGGGATFLLHFVD